MTLLDKLGYIVSLDVGNKIVNADLKNYSTWKVGGIADLIVEPQSEEQLIRILNVIKQYNIPFVIIGNGSNLLFSDDGVRGVVIKLCKNFNKVNISNNIIVTQAGAWIPCLAYRTAKLGLSGLEHTIGIPATIGGLVVMNGGSKRQSISEIIQSVKIITATGEKKILDKLECKFDYRTSIFQDNNWIITEVTLLAQAGEKNDIKSDMLRTLRERRSKFPLRYPSCGSVFKSYPEIYDKYGAPGKIIEDLGLKGIQIGGAVIAEQHANFIINLGDATAKDILQLISHVRDVTYKRLGIWLECEAKYVKSDGIIEHIDNTFK